MWSAQNVFCLKHLAKQTGACLRLCDFQPPEGQFFALYIYIYICQVGGYGPRSPNPTQSAPKRCSTFSKGAARRLPCSGLSCPPLLIGNSGGKQKSHMFTGCSCKLHNTYIYISFSGSDSPCQQPSPEDLCEIWRC